MTAIATSIALNLAEKTERTPTMNDLDRDLNNALDAIDWLLCDLDDVGNEDELYDLWCVLEDAKAEIKKVQKARKSE